MHLGITKAMNWMTVLHFPTLVQDLVLACKRQNEHMFSLCLMFFTVGRKVFSPLNRWLSFLSVGVVLVGAGSLSFCRFLEFLVVFLGFPAG